MIPALQQAHARKMDLAAKEGATALDILQDIRRYREAHPCGDPAYGFGGWFDCECGLCLDGHDFHAWEAFTDHAVEAIHYAALHLSEADFDAVRALDTSAGETGLPDDLPTAFHALCAIKKAATNGALKITENERQALLELVLITETALRSTKLDTSAGETPQACQSKLSIDGSSCVLSGAHTIHEDGKGAFWNDDPRAASPPETPQETTMNMRDAKESTGWMQTEGPLTASPTFAPPETPTIRPEADEKGQPLRCDDSRDPAKFCLVVGVENPCRSCQARLDSYLSAPPQGWQPLKEWPYGPDGAGGQVWVAYPNHHHPKGWNLRVQWTPITSEHAVEPMFWCPVVFPGYPPPLPAPPVSSREETEQ